MGRLSISTFNCYGFVAPIAQSITTLHTNPFIIMLQETWKYNLDAFQSLNEKRFQYIHVATMEPQKQTKGRPHGGMLC